MNTKTSLLTKHSMSLCLSLACAFSISSAKADLFESVTVAEADSVAKVDSDILKRRVVRVNFAEAAKRTHAGAKLAINLFDDLMLNGTVEKVEDRATKNYTLSGHLEGDEYSTFVLSVLEDVVAMNVRTADGKLYQIRSVQNGLHEICLVDQNKFPECGVKAEHAIAAPPAAADAAPQAQGDTANVIDVMVVYTTAARVAAGSSNAINAAINLAVTESNTAYQQSQINTQVRLVYAGEVAYTEAGFSTDLSRLTDPSDGFLDQVQTLRNTYGADLVSLWINDTSSCGLAWLMTTLSTGFAPNGFSVVHWGPQCATGYYSFAHEMAHNMGCTHDRAAASGQGLYSYSYGWHFTGTNGVGYRTIMAYAPDLRIQRFSNPNVNYFGTPTGVAIGQANESHNAQTINNSAFTVANFRQSVFDPGIIVQPQPQNVVLGATATFSVTPSGTAPFYYFWRRAGTNINGVSTSSSYNITNVQISDATNYSVLVSNSVGTILSSNAALTIDNFASAVDNTGFTWSHLGNAQWFSQTAITHDGVDAAESGAITHNGATVFQTPIVGPGTLSFWWKVSSEPGFDYLDILLDGAIQFSYGISGESGWSPVSFPVPAGAHTIGWQYAKDVSDSSGADKAWVDQISYVGGSSFVTNSLGKTNGQYKFVFSGLAGANYSVQASTNLTNWATLTNLLINTPSNLFIDTSSTNLDKRFYRVKSP